MSANQPPRRYEAAGFEDFRRLAADASLSAHEKIGFPDAYREGHEQAIVGDIIAKLPALSRPGACVLDVGPGCAGVPRMLIDRAARLGQALHLVDSAEMLDQLPDADGVHKTAARFPDCPCLIDQLRGGVDALIVYSVLQYIVVDTSLVRFLDTGLALLAPGGAMLLGDIPNTSARKRFFASQSGKDFHRQFTGRDEDPDVRHLVIEDGAIDDSLVFAILQRARAAGFHSYVMPQPPQLPMANRREDVVIVRP
jgi:hypothetical protein